MEVGGSSSTSCLIAFGDNVNTLCPTMMMPSMTSHNADSNTLFLPLLPTTNIQNLNFHKSPGNSSVMVEERNNCGNNNNNSSTGYYFMGPGYGNHSSSSNNNNDEEWSFKAKIMAHPHYHRLLTAYVNCQKIGAPPEVLARLEEASSSAVAMGRSSKSSIGDDPSLDQFMEAYCEMLTKYEQELTKPFKEAMLFLSRIESQLKAFTLTSDSACPQAMDINGSSEEEVDVNNSSIDPLAEDRELKGQLLRKYSGYLGSLKQEFMKKRKKGKLPKEARQQLLEWWGRHYKWPYPSESQKLALAESTGLDQKQINNWFINQRKRHWKPSEDMQFVVMDAATAAAAAAHSHYYMDNVLGNPFSMDISSSFL